MAADAARLREVSEMLFEPTGDLAKDYSAYCETEDRPERDDLVDSVQMAEQRDPDNITRVKTCLIARHLDYCLNKRDLVPLANAIPHCPTLSTIQFTGCGITEHSIKVLVEAVYKSPSVTSVAVDFNPNGLFKDPTVAKKDKNEVFLLPTQLRSAHLRAPQEPEHAAGGKDDKKPGAKPDPKKAAVAALAAAASAAPKFDETPIAVPTGFHALLLTAVQSISLRGNAITDKQVEPLSALLEANTDLLNLSLWGNAITSVGATSLAKALRSNRKLTSLNLGSNKIDDAGAIALANVLLVMDVSNEEASKLRLKTLHIAPNQPGADMPPLPTWADMCAALGQPEDKTAPKGKGGAAAPAAKAKAKGAEGPIERPKTDFDKDCFRIDENRIRVPGNTVLWGLDLTMNPLTPTAVRSWIQVLRAREPHPHHDDAAPPHPNYSASLSLERVEIDFTGDLAPLRQEFASALAEWAPPGAASTESGPSA